MTEAKLNSAIEQLKNGSEIAFAEIYDAYSAALFGVILKIIQDQEAAEDILQNAWVKIWKNAKKFDANKGSFFTWMLNIARNTAIDAYRKKTRNTVVKIQNTENGVSNSKALSISLNIDKFGIKDLLIGLPEEQQIIIEYIYFKGYTQQETSDELELPLGTVKTRARNAVKALREIFSILITWI